jgi:hypothetical protein
MNGCLRLTTGGMATLGWALVFSTLYGFRPLSAQSFVTPVMVVARPDPGQPYRYVGGRTVTIPVVVHAPRPEGLMIRVELVQLSSSPAAPVAHVADISLGEAGQRSTGAVFEPEVPVALPSVGRETDFELRFQSLRPREPGAQPAGRVGLRVYPDNLLDPVRLWAESHVLRVEDDDGVLADFLREQRIAVTTRPGRSDLTVTTASRSAPELDAYPRTSSGSLIIFSEREASTPHLVVARTGRGVTVTVEMRLLDRLAHDPFAQKILLEAFQHAAAINDEAWRQGVTR